VRGIWAVARLDLAVWLQSPWAIAAAVIPPAAMLLLVKVLTVAVTAQPVALVIADPGPQAQVMAGFIEADKGSYFLKIVNAEQAQQLLEQQRVAAVIEIPKGFGAAVAEGRGELHYTLNNVDIDVADDIRRSVDRSVAQFDAPQFGAVFRGGLTPANPYRVDVAETDLRHTDVAFGTYQLLPVLLLLVITLGVLGGALLGSRDHERGTRVFLELTPLPRSSFVVGRLLGTLLITLGLVAPVVLYLTWRGSVAPPPGHWPPFVAVLVATAVLSSALGTLLGVVLRRATTVALAGVTVASYLFFLGGGFTTIAFLPGWLRTISRGVPTRYAIDAMRQTLFYPDLKDVTTNLVALAAFAGATLICSVLALGRRTR
jgi:ABC-2 type transport system permease protein